jgi:hypothetical protein
VNHSRTRATEAALANVAAGLVVGFTGTALAQPVVSPWAPVAVLAAFLGLIATLCWTIPYLISAGWEAAKGRRVRAVEQPAEEFIAGLAVPVGAGRPSDLRIPVRDGVRPHEPLEARQSRNIAAAAVGRSYDRYVIPPPDGVYLSTVAPAAGQVTA